MRAVRLIVQNFLSDSVALYVRGPLGFAESEPKAARLEQGLRNFEGRRQPSGKSFFVKEQAHQRAPIGKGWRSTQ